METLYVIGAVCSILAFMISILTLALVNNIKVAISNSVSQNTSGVGNVVAGKNIHN